MFNSGLLLNDITSGTGSFPGDFRFSALTFSHARALTAGPYLARSSAAMREKDPSWFTAQRTNTLSLNPAPNLQFARNACSAWRQSFDNGPLPYSCSTSRTEPFSSLQCWRSAAAESGGTIHETHRSAARATAKHLLLLYWETPIAGSTPSHLERNTHRSHSLLSQQLPKPRLYIRFLHSLWKTNMELSLARPVWLSTRTKEE